MARFLNSICNVPNSERIALLPAQPPPPRPLWKSTIPQATPLEVPNAGISLSPGLALFRKAGSRDKSYAASKPPNSRIVVSNTETEPAYRMRVCLVPNLRPARTHPWYPLTRECPVCRQESPPYFPRGVATLRNGFQFVMSPGILVIIIPNPFHLGFNQPRALPTSPIALFDILFGRFSALPVLRAIQQRYSQNQILSFRLLLESHRYLARLWNPHLIRLAWPCSRESRPKSKACATKFGTSLM